MWRGRCLVLSALTMRVVFPILHVRDGRCAADCPCLCIQNAGPSAFATAGFRGVHLVALQRERRVNAPAPCGALVQRDGSVGVRFGQRKLAFDPPGDEILPTSGGLACKLRASRLQSWVRIPLAFDRPAAMWYLIATLLASNTLLRIFACREDGVIAMVQTYRVRSHDVAPLPSTPHGRRSCGTSS